MTPGKGLKLRLGSLERETQRELCPQRMRVGEKGGPGQDFAEVVDNVETDRHGDSHETDNGPNAKINVIQDFFKPVAKRAK